MGSRGEGGVIFGVLGKVKTFVLTFVSSRVLLVMVLNSSIRNAATLLLIFLITVPFFTLCF